MLFEVGGTDGNHAAQAKEHLGPQKLEEAGKDSSSRAFRESMYLLTP